MFKCQFSFFWFIQKHQNIIFSLVLSLIILPLSIHSQTVKQSVFLSPDLSYYNVPKTYVSKIWILGLGGSLGYRLEYSFKNKSSIGISGEYFLTRSKIYTDDHSGIPEVATRNLISIHSINIPLCFKLKLKNNDEETFNYFIGGLGITWIFYSFRKLENESSFYATKRKDRVLRKLTSGKFNLNNVNGNNIDFSFQFGLGRKFHIKNSEFYTEFMYFQDFNSWIYETNRIDPPYEKIREYPFFRQSIVLSIGMCL